MKNFIEISTGKIGEQIAAKLNQSFDFGVLATPMIEDGRTFYVDDEKEITLTDTQKYQAFHLVGGDLQPSPSKNPFPLAKAKTYQTPMVFLLFGWMENSKDDVWSVLEVFQDNDFAHKDGIGQTLLSANVKFARMNFSPAAIVRKYFGGSWPGVQHKQGTLIALEITYLLDVNTCKYCFA